MRVFFLNNIGLKFLALLLAVATWIYVVIELQQGSIEEKEMLQNILPPYRFVSKKVPVKLNLVGEPETGYYVAYDRIVIKPSDFMIVGPKSIISRMSSVETQPVDITGSSKTFITDVSVISPTKAMIKDKFITITVPILRQRE
jgi:YbbR domain-containing protein